MISNQFMTAEDVQHITGRSKTYCYNLIRQLNDELRDRGYMTIRGKVQTAYFLERFKLAEHNE